MPDACHDPMPLSIWFQIIKDVQPTRIIHAGDICDLGNLSSFTKKVNRMGQVLAKDGKWYETPWGKTLQMIETFWKVTADFCPNTEFHQLEGNHDFWTEVLLDDPFLSQFRDQIALRGRPIWNDLGVKYYPYDGSPKLGMQPWVEVGNTHVMHGYGAGSPSMMEKEHDNVMYGHIHRFEKSLGTDKTSREYRREAISIGCMCNLDPKFSTKGGKQNGWVHGFGVIYTKGEKTTKRWVEITQGEILEPLHGKFYQSVPLKSIDRRLQLFEF